MMERRKEKLCDCILGMFYLSLKIGKTYSSAPQIYQTLFDGTKKNSPKPAGLYLFNKSMSFILITNKEHFSADTTVTHIQFYPQGAAQN